MTHIKILIYIVFIAAVSSCYKDKNAIIPEHFTKKVIIEEFSGEWCSSCVQGAKRFSKVIEEDPEKYIGVSIHKDDPFEIEFPKIADLLISEFSIEYFPFAIIDRTSNADIGWIAQANSRSKINYGVGLKIITSIHDKEMDIKISIASNTEDYKNIFLSVYLVEDNVPESSNGAQNGGGGNYIHHHVLRKVLTGKVGEPIDLPANTIIEKEINSINVARFKIEDLKVVAFIHFGSLKSFEVMNSNSIFAGKNSVWN